MTARPMKPAERRAMTDAIRHMCAAGERLVRHGTGATPWQVAQSINTILLPGRDGIGPSLIDPGAALVDGVGAVSPRQTTSIAGDFLPDCAGERGRDALVSPAASSVSPQRVDSIGQSGADSVGCGFFHDAVMAHLEHDGHGAAPGQVAP